MTGTPERIWVWEYGRSAGEPQGAGEWYGEDVGLDGDEVSYIREDVSQAMVAAALREVENVLFFEICPNEQLDAIRVITPDDARSALDRLIAEAVEDVWSAVETLAAAGTPPDGMLSIAKANTEAIRARKG